MPHDWKWAKAVWEKNRGQTRHYPFGLYLVTQVESSMPAVGCLVITSIGGASAFLIVAGPTVSGVHDMERVVEPATHFRVQAVIQGKTIFEYDRNSRAAHAVKALWEKLNRRTKF